MINWFYNDFDKKAADAVFRTIGERKISMGSVTQELEESLANYTRSKFCLAVTSGTTALWVTMRALIEEGDEVLVQARTWVATVHAIREAGGRPVICDMEKTGRYLDLSSLERRLTKRTRALIVTHMNGRILNLRKVKEFCEKFDILLIEDAAQALGATFDGYHPGHFSDVACYSLAVTKIVSGGQGGLVVTNRSDINRFVKSFRKHGLDDLDYITDWKQPGFNIRYTDIQATLAYQQFLELNDRVNHLYKVREIYRGSITNNDQLELVENKKNEVGPYVECLVDDRKQFIEFMLSAGVQVKPFYPSMAEIKYLKKNYSCPNADQFCNKGVYLPCGPSISLEKVRHVCKILDSYI